MTTTPTVEAGHHYQDGTLHSPGGGGVNGVRRAVALAAGVLAFVGFLISFYLTVSHYRNAIPPCYGTSGCESVVTSKYAVIAGVPVSLAGSIFFAVTFYLAIALATIDSRLVVRLYEVFATAGALVAVFLFLVQALILDAYCSYCLTTEVIALLLWGSTLLPLAARASPSLEGGLEPH